VAVQTFVQLELAEYDQWSRRDLTAKRYVYLWADGIHVNVRLEDWAILCARCDAKNSRKARSSSTKRTRYLVFGILSSWAGNGRKGI
jgi:hypothetical protein